MAKSPHLTTDEKRVLVTLYRWLYGVYKYTGHEPSTPGEAVILTRVPWYRLIGVLCVADGTSSWANWTLAIKALRIQQFVESEFWAFVNPGDLTSRDAALNNPYTVESRRDPAHDRECWQLANECNPGSHVRFCWVRGEVEGMDADRTDVIATLLDADGAAVNSIELPSSRDYYHLTVSGFTVAREQYFAALGHSPWKDAAAGATDGDASASDGDVSVQVEWSPPMTGAEIARRYKRSLKARWRDVKPLMKITTIERVEGNTHRVRLDKLD